MLADRSTAGSSGRLALGVVPSGQSRAAIFDFVTLELPRWRDRPDRPKRVNETSLTNSLSSHLNTAARRTAGFDSLQFKQEEGDELKASRTYDLVAAPAVEKLIVEGRTYSDFAVILPIECKRLPTPKGTKRDQREYVFTDNGSTGGIQRFKEGLHGAAHVRAGMIGYIQEQGFEHWESMVQGWIDDLHANGTPGWSPADSLNLQYRDKTNGLAVYESAHARPGKLKDIGLRHVWLKMTK